MVASPNKGEFEAGPARTARCPCEHVLLTLSICQLNVTVNKLLRGEASGGNSFRRDRAGDVCFSQEDLWGYSFEKVAFVPPCFEIQRSHTLDFMWITGHQIRDPALLEASMLSWNPSAPSTILSALPYVPSLPSHAVRKGNE